MENETFVKAQELNTEITTCRDLITDLRKPQNLQIFFEKFAKGCDILPDDIDGFAIKELILENINVHICKKLAEFRKL